MDRFEYIEARLFDGETYLKRNKNVKIYDGEDKVKDLILLNSLQEIGNVN